MQRPVLSDVATVSVHDVLSVDIAKCVNCRWPAGMHSRSASSIGVVMSRLLSHSSLLSEALDAKMAVAPVASVKDSHIRPLAPTLPMASKRLPHSPPPQLPVSPPRRPWPSPLQTLRQIGSCLRLPCLPEHLAHGSSPWSELWPQPRTLSTGPRLWRARRLACCRPRLCQWRLSRGGSGMLGDQLVATNRVQCNCSGTHP